MKLRVVFYSLVLGLFTIVTSLKAAVTIDGTLDGDYGTALVTQNTQTQFGDANAGTVGGANGSELDVGHAVIQGGTLFLFLGGNLESNFNKLDIFIDSIAGGQNQLRGDNPNVDGNGLNRMGDVGGGGGANGLKFDAGFAADYYLMVTEGNAGPDIFANFSEILTGGGGTGNYIGQTTAASAGTLTGGTNPYGILLTVNNANIAGVTSGTGAASGAGVTTGIEIAIPLSAIGNPVGNILVTAMINGGGHDFLSNQILGGIGGGANLGEPRTTDLSNIAGDQFFTVVPEPSTLAFLGLGVIGVGIRTLRRKIA